MRYKPLSGAVECSLVWGESKGGRNRWLGWLGKYVGYMPVMSWASPSRKGPFCGHLSPGLAPVLEFSVQSTFACPIQSCWHLTCVPCGQASLCLPLDPTDVSYLFLRVSWGLEVLSSIRTRGPWPRHGCQDASTRASDHTEQPAGASPLPLPCLSLWPFLPAWLFTSWPLLEVFNLICLNQPLGAWLF